MTLANKASESKRHHISAYVLFGLAALCILIAINCLYYFPSRLIQILAWIGGAMLLGKYGFDHLEKYAQLKPESEIRHEMELFGSALKDQSNINVFVELHYPVDQDSQYVFDRIRAHLQRTLNMKLSELDTLPAQPYQYIDEILNNEVPELRSDLSLRNISIKTIAIRGGTAVSGVRFKTV